jgi:hypothetical protein
MMPFRDLKGPFVWKRGDGSKRRVNHLAGFNRLGQFAGALCGSSLDFDTSCNLPLGKPTCKRCSRRWNELSNG